MKNHESVRLMTPGQAKDLAATLAGAAPTNLTYEEAKVITGDKERLVAGIHQLVRLLRLGWDVVIERRACEVVVDYSLTLAEMIAANHYNNVDPRITPDNFLLEGVGRCKLIVILFHFNRKMTDENVLTIMHAQGFRPTKIEELLALDRTPFRFDREFPVVGLGSTCHDPDQDPDGDYSAPSLSSSGSNMLFLTRLDCPLDPIYRFAAVRRSD